MSKIDLFLEKNACKIMIIFLIMQPILDVISGISQNFLNVSFSINVIIRVLFLLCSIFYLLFISRNRKISILYLILVFIYSCLFMTCVFFNKGFDALFYEFKNLVLVFYFPILLITFFNLFDQYDIKFDLKYFVYVYVIYLFFISIPNFLGISFESYTQGKIGSSGWFNSANAISSILSILLPFLVIYFRDKFLNWKLFLISLLFFYSIFSLGTKVPYLSFCLIFIFNFIYLFIMLFKDRHYKLIGILTGLLVVLIIGFCLIIPRTSFYQNIKIHLNFLGVESVHEVITNIDVIDRFIFSDRLTFLLNSKDVYDNASSFQKLVGIGYIENYGTDEVSTKLIEMDYYDIFYRHGVIGCVIYFTPLVYITYLIIKKCQNLNFISLNLFLSICLIFVLAFFSGHVFTVPSVSVFVAFILSFVYYCHNFKIN